MRDLNNFEKLSLVIAAQSAAKNNGYYVDPNLVAELVSYGNEWALTWEYDFLKKEPHSKDAIVDETVEILEMFQHLQSSEKELTGSIKETRHDGFDGNNDDHYGIARVLTQDLKRFTDLAGAGLNSHSIGSLSTYQKMLKKYRPIADAKLKDAQYNLLSTAEINTVLGK